MLRDEFVIDTEDAPNVIVDKLVKHYIASKKPDAQLRDVTIFMMNFTYVEEGAWTMYAQSSLFNNFEIYRIRRTTSGDLFFEVYSLLEGEAYTNQIEEKD